MSRSLKNVRTGKILLCLCLSIMVILILPFEAAAANVRTIPDSFLDSNNNLTVLALNRKTYDSYQFHGVNGGKYVGTNGNIAFTVPADETKAFSYTDFLDVYFKDVGELGGRKLNTQIHFDSISINKAYSSGYSGYTNADEWTVLFITGTLLQNKVTILSSGFDNYRWLYCAKGVMRTTFIITYADTGEVVDVPFFQSVYDIDRCTSNYVEWWEGVSGYDGTIYKYQSNINTISGMKVSSNEDTYNNNDAMTGSDSWLKAGVIVPTINGEFTCEWGLGDCGTVMKVYVPYSDIQDPVKEADTTQTYKPGDALEYTITEQKPTFLEDVFSCFTSMVFRDELPQEVDYQGAKFYDDGKDVTSSYGTLDYDEAAHTVTYTLKSSVLNNEDFYDGKELKLVIQTCTAGINDLSNQALVDIGEVEYKTNEVAPPVEDPTPDPEKMILDHGTETLSVERTVGEEVVYQITQQVLDAQSSTFRYNSFQFADALPDGVSCQDAKILDENGNNITDQGSLSMDGQLITFSFSESYLDSMPMKGETYLFQITCKVEDSVEGQDKLTNKAYTVLNDTKRETNPCDVIPCWKITTEVVNGTITESQFHIPAGEDCQISYQPNDGYYLESVMVDGQEIDTKEYPDGYLFQKIGQDHEIRVVYALDKVKVHIYKKIDMNSVVWAKGNPVFLFKICGEDVYGKSRTYYRTIEFHEEDPEEKCIELKVYAGTYTVSELDTNDWILDSAEAVANATADGKTVILEANEKGEAGCRFYNSVSDYGNYTDTNLVYNSLIE